MAVLLSYDVKRTTETVHTDLKNRLINNYGYHQTILASNNNNYQLPNTTLRKEGVTPQQSSVDFLNACRDVNAVWEKYIASEYGRASFDNQ